MLKQIRPALVPIMSFTIITGLIYPFAVTAVARTVYRKASNGSPVRRGETRVGSSLIGEAFASDDYFDGRLFAAGTNGYDAGGDPPRSDLGPTSKVSSASA